MFLQYQDKTSYAEDPKYRKAHKKTHVIIHQPAGRYIGESMENIEKIGKRILGAAIKVHSHLGPGLLESAYQKCHAYEMKNQGLKVLCEVPLPVKYEGLCIDVGYRID